MGAKAIKLGLMFNDDYRSVGATIYKDLLEFFFPHSNVLLNIVKQHN